MSENRMNYEVVLDQQPVSDKKTVPDEYQYTLRDPEYSDRHCHFMRRAEGAVYLFASR